MYSKRNEWRKEERNIQSEHSSKSICEKENKKKKTKEITLLDNKLPGGKSREPSTLNASKAFHPGT